MRNICRTVHFVYAGAEKSAGADPGISGRYLQYDCCEGYCQQEESNRYDDAKKRAALCI